MRLKCQIRVLFVEWRIFLASNNHEKAVFSLKKAANLLTNSGDKLKLSEVSNGRTIHAILKTIPNYF